MKASIAAELAFNFAIRSGDSGRLSIRGKDVTALLVEAPQITGDRTTAGHSRSRKTAEVSILASALGFEPRPGERCKLDAWDCEIPEDGIAYLPGGYQIALTSART